LAGYHQLPIDGFIGQGFGRKAKVICPTAPEILLKVVDGVKEAA
jgi:hypothetical protein